MAASYWQRAIAASYRGELSRAERAGAVERALAARLVGRVVAAVVDMGPERAATLADHVLGPARARGRHRSRAADVAARRVARAVEFDTEAAEVATTRGLVPG